MAIADLAINVDQPAGGGGDFSIKSRKDPAVKISIKLISITFGAALLLAQPALGGGGNAPQPTCAKPSGSAQRDDHPSTNGRCLTKSNEGNESKNQDTRNQEKAAAAAAQEAADTRNIARQNANFDKNRYKYGRPDSPFQSGRSNLYPSGGGLSTTSGRGGSGGGGKGASGQR